MAAAGLSEVIAARLDPNDLHEDEVAWSVANALCGSGLTLTPAATGRCNLVARAAGVLVLGRQVIETANNIDEAITVATLQPFATVKARQVVATVKVIPFAVPASAVQKVILGLGQKSALRLSPFSAKRVGAVLTTLPGFKKSLIEKYERSLHKRAKDLGSELAHVAQTPHTRAAVRITLGRLIKQNFDLLIIGGASAIMDRRDVIPAAITDLGGTIERYGMPVDPGNLLLLGQVGSKQIVAMPGCARSIKENGFDWVLARLLADLSVTSKDVAGMGVGGLLEKTFSRDKKSVVTAEVRSFGKSLPKDDRPQIGAVVLAAGQSSRMGSQNKLLIQVNGSAIVRTTVQEVRRARISDLVVVTGHQANAVAQALAGIDARIVKNDNYQSGLSTSVKCGLAALSADLDGAMICLGDMPFVKTDLLERLIDGFEETGSRRICVPCFSGRRGNPVLWGKWFFDDLQALEGDQGGRLLFRKYADLVEEIDLEDEAVLTDIDRPEDLHQNLVPESDL
ncbi:MAG: molybdopterin-binding/glycosyltransferase family 2 protein [Pseudomonadota bacterium]